MRLEFGAMYEDGLCPTSSIFGHRSESRNRQTHPMPNHKARGELDAMYTSRLLKHRLDSGQTFSIIKQVAY